MTCRLKLSSLLVLLLFLCCACIGPFASKEPTFDFHEQLYIDGRLHFTINHPLNWQRVDIPVSSPRYQQDTVLWRIYDPQQTDTDFTGKMRIRAYSDNRQHGLLERLRDLLPPSPEPDLTQAEVIEHSAGSAIRLVLRDTTNGLLIVAIRGQERDFALSISFPTPRFDELLPVFEEIVQSFNEVSVDRDQH